MKKSKFQQENPLRASAVSTTIAPSPKKVKKLIVDTKEHGIGYVIAHEPKVIVKQGQISVEKTIVHLVNEDMTPRMKKGVAQQMLMRKENFTYREPVVVTKEKKVRVPRIKKEKGPKLPKDFTKYKFGGVELSKGKLVLAIISRFVKENNPTMLDLNKAFPAADVKAYGKGLFVPVEEALKINEESKRTRFFTKADEVIKLKSGKIAVTNQIDAALVSRILPIAAGLKYAVTTVEATAKEEKSEPVKKTKKVVIDENVKPAKKTVKKAVVDFSTMTAKEIIAHIEKVSGEKITMSLKNKKAIIKKAELIINQ